MNKTLQEFKDGETVYAQGDMPRAAYVVAEGTVELEQDTGSGPMATAFLHPGETFGEDSLRAGTPQVATARAVGRVVVEVLTGTALLAPTQSGKRETGRGFFAAIMDRLRALGAPPPQGTSPQPPKLATIGMFDRLLGGGAALSVHIAHFIGAEPTLSKQLAQTLARRPGLRVKVLKATIDARAIAKASDEKAPVELVDPPPERISARHLAATTDVARTAALKAKADLLIWGEVAASGTSLTLHFTPAHTEDEDRPGLFAGIITLVIPIDIPAEWGGLLYSVILAAASSKDDALAQQTQRLLPAAMDAARDLAHNLPFDLGTQEQAAVRLSFANVTSQVAMLHASGHLYAQAAELYINALGALQKEMTPLRWALAQRNLAVALSGVADAGGDDMNPDLTVEMALNAAVDAYRAAAQVLSKDVLALSWAALQNRLGLALYKLDAKSQDAEILKHTLSAYQSALHVFSPTQSPIKWAEVMHNLAQAAQVLGGQLRNQELLQKAVDACRAALRVRRQDKFPLLWAATQNNLGSALFLLAQISKEREPLEQAAEAFAQVRDFHQQAGNDSPAAIAGRNLAHVEKLLAALDKKNGTGNPPRMKWEPPEHPVDEPTEGADPSPPAPDDKP